MADCLLFVSLGQLSLGNLLIKAKATGYGSKVWTDFEIKYFVKTFQTKFISFVESFSLCYPLRASTANPAANAQMLNV